DLVHHLDRAELLRPFLGARPDVERDEIAVGRGEVDGVAEYRDAAVADLDAAAAAREGEAPQLLAGARVDGIHVVRCREIEDAADLERGSLDGAGGRQVVEPREADVLDVRRVDVRQRAETPARQK